MVYISGENKRYKCTAPDEHCISIWPQSRQWVIDFTICDNITASELDGLLEEETLSFIHVDEQTEEEKVLNFEGYCNVNSAAIKYNIDLSCTASVQLGKEIEEHVRKV